MQEMPLDLMGRGGTGGKLGHSCPLDSPDEWIEMGGCGMGNDLWLLAAH